MANALTLPWSSVKNSGAGSSSPGKRSGKDDAVIAALCRRVAAWR
ncbi:hypothetical protein [Mycobacteroides salmoniphilum]|nr:hypothetical protein [Mycobacteroides salmoniphilum]